MRRGLCILAVLAPLAAPAAGEAAVTIGQLPPMSANACGGGRTVLQVKTSHAPPYTAPGPGVITSFKTKDMNSIGSVTLKVMALQGGTVWRVAATDMARPVLTGTATYPNPMSSQPVRVPVAGGEQLAFYLASGDTYQCYFPTDSSEENRGVDGSDPAAGDSLDFNNLGAFGRLNLEAVVEPDADRDGFGDETQDGCRSAAGDNDGCPLIVDASAPTVSKLAFSPATFRAAGSGAGLAKAKVGAKLDVVVSEASTATFRVERRAKGRKKGKKCVAPTRKNRRAKRCTRYVRLKGSLGHALAAGNNSLRFRGRLGGRKLRPARYRLVMVATDVAGNRSKPKLTKFRIVKR
jgi:hypothetical protein